MNLIMLFFIILLFIILALILVLIYIKSCKSVKKGGNIKNLLIQSNLQTEEIQKNVDLLKEALDNYYTPLSFSETEKIKNFINNNEVTEFITKKDKKKHSLVELLKLLKSGNMPQGTIYTNIKNNTYIYG